jgi:hypothetical protein
MGTDEFLGCIRTYLVGMDASSCRLIVLIVCLQSLSCIKSAQSKRQVRAEYFDAEVELCFEAHRRVDDSDVDTVRADLWRERACKLCEESFCAAIHDRKGRWHTACRGLDML